MNTHKPKCESLEQVRKEIDQLDQAIIALLAQRQEYVDQSVRFKSSVQDIQAPERVEQVMSKVREQAELNRLDPDFVEKIYRELIQHFIQRESKEFRP